MAILVSLCRRVRNEELDFPSDVNSANLFRLAMSRRPQDPICIVFSWANHPHNLNLLTRALYFSFFYQLNWQSVLQTV